MRSMLCKFFLSCMYMRLLDLFAGTHSVGTVARALGFEVVSLDLCDASICCDVMDWRHHDANETASLAEATDS